LASLGQKSSTVGVKLWPKKELCGDKLWLKKGITGVKLKKCISRGGKKIRIHHQQNHNQNQNNDFDIESANELKRSRSK
jgi:hypothetical protein